MGRWCGSQGRALERSCGIISDFHLGEVRKSVLRLWGSLPAPASKLLDPEIAMSFVDPNQNVLLVLLFSTVAALLAATGALPFIGRTTVPAQWGGFSYALASGLMLGSGYILMVEGLGLTTLSVAVGAVLGVVYTYWTHVFSGTRELDHRPPDGSVAEYSIKFILLNALHSAPEGVAIGVAMVVDIPLGIFVAAALAVHNIAEAIVLMELLRANRAPLQHAAAISVVTNVPQILMAIVTFAIVPAVPDLLPWTLGFASGAMGYLVMTDLLPFSYARAGRTGVALVVSLSAGAVVLLRGLLG